MSTETQVAKIDKTLADSVLLRVNQFKNLGELKLPADYSPENALKSAWLLLLETKDRDNKPVLETCSKESIANALFSMVVQGLSPMKRQCSFIAYGGKLQMQREYAGSIALAKRYGGVKDVTANVIYKGDDFQYEIDGSTGRKKIVKHIQKFEDIEGNNILGAYATLIMEDGTTDVEVMTMKQINAAWQQGATKGNSPAHKGFPDQMAKKTVINRACKLRITTSDDSALIGDDETDYVVETHKEVLHNQANKGQEVEIEMDDEPVKPQAKSMVVEAEEVAEPSWS